MILLFQGQLHTLSPPLACAEDTDFTLHNPDTNETNFAQIMESILENQEKILLDIESERDNYRGSVHNDIVHLNKVHHDIHNDYNRIYKLYWINRDQPAELSLIAEQISRFIFQITELYEPLRHTHEHVQERVEQLDNIIHSLKIISGEATLSMLQRATDLRNAYATFDKRLSTVMTVTKDFLQTLAKTYDDLEARMPRFWLEHYLNTDVNFFANMNIWTTSTYPSQAFSLISLNVTRETPSTWHAWLLFGTNFLMFIAPFVLIGSVLYRYINVLLPPAMHEASRHTLVKILPWIIVGISVQFASWHDGNRYQIIHALGTFLLCYGQILLSWQLLCLKREEAHPVKSPFIVFLSVLVMAFIMLTGLDITRIFSIPWAIFLLYMLLRARRRPAAPFPFSHGLLKSFYVVMGIGLLVILIAGHAHLSFFIILLYMCLVMGLHQSEACLHATSFLNDCLPKSGLSALIYGLLLAIILPIILTIALVSPLSWLLAFPGGEYLLKTLSDFHIEIGNISFNAVQILTIATIFYLVKSIVGVSCNYIDSTWRKHDNESLVALTTPIKTIIFFGFWGIFALYVLQSIGFDLSNLAVVAGGLSVGLGLGMQGIVQNTFSGFSLIFGQNIREGDVVEVGTIKGIVQKVSLRATRVRTFDNAIVFVPNSEFMSASFFNWTHNGHKIRCNIFVGVAYDSELALFKKIILDILENDPRVAPNPTPSIYFIDFASSSLNFEVRFWVYQVLEQMEIRSDIRFAMNAAFKENGIKVPYPQTDIHVNTHTLDLLLETPKNER